MYGVTFLYQSSFGEISLISFFSQRIILVGGFAESPYLNNALEEWCWQNGDITLICPEYPYVIPPISWFIICLLFLVRVQLFVAQPCVASKALHPRWNTFVGIMVLCLRSAFGKVLIQRGSIFLTAWTIRSVVAIRWSGWSQRQVIKGQSKTRPTQLTIITLFRETR